MRANEILEFGKRRMRVAYLRPHSAGNVAFAVLPQAKKRRRNAVKRVGSYSVQAVAPYPLFRGCMTTGRRHPSATGRA
jgi:hypothetical protein